MTIAEIKSIEGARQEADTWNVVHLIKEGDFYRAHDWSAWLMTKYPIGEAANSPLKVIAKKLKDEYIDAFCGFPATSIGKYIPQGSDFKAISDIQIDIKVELPADIGEVSFENLNKMKEEWKNSLPLQEARKQRREEQSISAEAPRFLRFSDILGRILSLEMDNITPREAVEILRDLRRQIAAMY